MIKKKKYIYKKEWMEKAEEKRGKMRQFHFSTKREKVKRIEKKKKKVGR